MPAKFNILLKFSLIILTFLFLGFLLSEKTYAQETTILRPNGPGDFSQWTRTGCSSDWQCVDEVSSDGDSTNVFSTGGDEIGFYDLPTSTIPAGSTIHSVTVLVRARSDFKQFLSAFNIGVRTNSANNFSIEKFPLMSTLKKITTHSVTLGRQIRLQG